jgi:hypothetical protein
MRGGQCRFLLALIVLLPFLVIPANAQRGSLIVQVSPPETYIDTDGAPVIESKGHYITLPAGEHKIDLYNLGYWPESRNVTIEAGKTTVIDVTFCWENNRRVDVQLSTGNGSQRSFPYDSRDLKVLLGSGELGGKETSSLR